MLFKFLIGPPLKVWLVLQRRFSETQVTASKILLGGWGGMPHFSIFDPVFRGVKKHGLILHEG
jgi:hypothetical protein